MKHIVPCPVPSDSDYAEGQRVDLSEIGDGKGLAEVTSRLATWKSFHARLRLSGNCTERI